MRRILFLAALTIFLCVVVSGAVRAATWTVTQTTDAPEMSFDFWPSYHGTGTSGFLNTTYDWLAAAAITCPYSDSNTSWHEGLAELGFDGWGDGDDANWTKIASTSDCPPGYKTFEYTVRLWTNWHVEGCADNLDSGNALGETWAQGQFAFTSASEPDDEPSEDIGDHSGHWNGRKKEEVPMVEVALNLSFPPGVSLSWTEADEDWKTQGPSLGETQTWSGNVNNVRDDTTHANEIEIKLRHGLRVWAKAIYQALDATAIARHRIEIFTLTP